MSARHANFVISVALLATLIGISALECDKQSPCVCHLSDGSSYNLTKLASEGPIDGTAKDYTWSFQPCRDVNITLEDNGAKDSECNNGTGVSLCAHSTKPFGTFSLGNTTETKWDVTSKEPRLILRHGTNTTEITLISCEKCTTSMSMDPSPGTSKFLFSLVSPHVRKVPPPPEGLSTGSVLVILLFVFSGVYLLIGALALRFFRGAIGWELVPNYDFWSDLPALVRDGIAFTFSGCSADSYDRI